MWHFWSEDAREIVLLPRQPITLGRIATWFEKITRDKNGVLSNIECWNRIPIELKKAPYLSFADSADWLDEYSRVSELSIEREITVRRQVWWVSQNHLRIEFDDRPMSSDVEVTQDEADKNRLALLHLHERGEIPFPAERVELLRQLSRFDECFELIIELGDKPKKFELILQIQILAKSQNSMVQVIPDRNQ